MPPTPSECDELPLAPRAIERPYGRHRRKGHGSNAVPCAPAGALTARAARRVPRVALSRRQQSPHLRGSQGRRLCERSAPSYLSPSGREHHRPALLDDMVPPTRLEGSYLWDAVLADLAFQRHRASWPLRGPAGRGARATLAAAVRRAWRCDDGERCRPVQRPQPGGGGRLLPCLRVRRRSSSRTCARGLTRRDPRDAARDRERRRSSVLVARARVVRGSSRRRRRQGRLYRPGPDSGARLSLHAGGHVAYATNVG